jgi:hypothetical protein
MRNYLILQATWSRAHSLVARGAFLRTKIKNGYNRLILPRIMGIVVSFEKKENFFT